MARDTRVERHIVHSKAKIEKAAPLAIEAERYIERTKAILERSRVLLKRLHALAEPTVAAAARPPRKKPAARKAKPSRRR